MKDFNFFTKIYLAVKPVDFRKQANGLFLLIEPIFKTMPNNSKTIFVFTNRWKNAVRMVYWDSTGVAMWSKRLANERFAWIKSNDNINLSVQKSSNGS